MAAATTSKFVKLIKVYLQPIKHFTSYLTLYYDNIVVIISCWTKFFMCYERKDGLYHVRESNDRSGRVAECGNFAKMGDFQQLAQTRVIFQFRFQN